MKALTLQRPWAAAFLLPTDPKRIENRVWTPPRTIFGQRIALHSGQGWWPNHEQCSSLLTTPAERDCWARLKDLTGIFATAVVTGVVPEPSAAATLFPVELDARVVTSRWWLGPFAWVLADFVVLQEPIQCKGAQGLWSVPEPVLAAIDSGAR